MALLAFDVNGREELITVIIHSFSVVHTLQSILRCHYSYTHTRSRSL